MEIRRFGPGHRRPEGPPGTTGLTGQVIHSGPEGTIAELAFSRRALITPHSNPNLTYFIVISGGGIVQVGDERARVNHGEAVVWPPGELHGAYTEGTEMRAIVVELPHAQRSHLIEGTVRPVEAASDVAAAEPGETAADRARGALAERTPTKKEYDTSAGEPW